MKWLTIGLIVSMALLVSCQSPPPPPPRPAGVPVAWPKPEPRKKPAASAKTTRPEPTGDVTQEPLAASPPEVTQPRPDTSRPHDDTPNPGEAIQASEKAKEAATSYVLDPRAQAPVIDKLTVLARNVRRARENMEAHRASNGQYNPDDVKALQQASDILESYRASKGD